MKREAELIRAYAEIAQLTTQKKQSSINEFSQNRETEKL